MPSAYIQLEERFRRAALLGESIGMLSWDQSVMMPEGGASARGEQIATLAVMRHSLMTDPVLGDLLTDATATGDLDDWQAANLHEMHRQWVHATAVPSDLVEAMSKASNACETVWRAARRDADFNSILPTFAEVLRLTRQVGEAKSAALDCGLYDALLDAFEPDGRCADIDPVFDSYASFLPDFLDDVLVRQSSRSEPKLPPGPFPVAAQRQLVRSMAETVGLNFDSARLDESLHPFSGGIPEDSRITTRYDEADFTLALMGVLHESGHAMYERARPLAWRRQPVGEARGMTAHESQSLLIEMQVCRSREFLGWAAPIMRDAFQGSGDAWSAENLYRLATRVSRGFIRVDADEVTYPAHVILRYRLESAMLAGDLAIAELPGAWNDGMTELLGVSPPDDRLGCLQDIHWYDGAWGYFPTYTLGAMAAAQIHAAARAAMADIPDGISRGDFQPLMTWLGDNIHSKGSLLSTNDLIARATGCPFDDMAFKAHLRTRYLEN
jgi:carboxypeptidase Taq